MTDEAILSERIAGRTLRDLADSTGMSHEGIRGVVIREGRKQIDRIELRLLANTKTDDLLAFVVPDHAGPDFDLAMSYLQWVTAQLTERGIKVKVHYQAVENGVVIALEDVSPEVTRPRRARP
jgi:hypothetical protein